VEPRLGPEYRRHPPQFEAGDTAYQGIALAQVGEDILVAWQVRQGKEIVLRVTRVRPQAN
jgi:hypothetical protein